MSSLAMRPAAGRRVHGFVGRPRVLALLVAIMVAAAAAAVAAVVAVRADGRHASLHVFGPVRDVQSGPVAVGRTVYAGEYAWPTGSQVLHLVSAAPVVATNTADADVKVLVCTLKPSALVATIGMAFSARPVCQSVRLFHPGTFTLHQGKADIVVAVTPHQPGRVHVAGVRLSYTRGSASGTQDTGINVHTQTPRA